MGIPRGIPMGIPMTLPLIRQWVPGLNPRVEEVMSPFPGLENGFENDDKMSPKMVIKWMQNGAIIASNASWRHSGNGLFAKRPTLTKPHYLLCFINIFMILWRSIDAPLVQKMQKSCLEQGLEQHLENNAKQF